jgi:hypothetical protein
VQVPTTRGIEDPVEAGGEDEKGDGVQDLVVDVGVELEAGQAQIGGRETEEEECAFNMSNVSGYVLLRLRRGKGSMGHRWGEGFTDPRRAALCA